MSPFWSRFAGRNEEVGEKLVLHYADDAIVGSAFLLNDVWVFNLISKWML
jgi:hypothetical protein